MSYCYAQIPHVNFGVLSRHIGTFCKSTLRAMTSSCTAFIWLLEISNGIFLSGAVRAAWHVKWSGGEITPPPVDQSRAVKDLDPRRVNTRFKDGGHQ